MTPAPSTAAEHRAVLEAETAAYERQRRRRNAATGDPDRRYQYRKPARQRQKKPAAPQRGPAWWCVIAAADHLEWDGQPPGEARREIADSMGLDPWQGGAP